jgi:hypothetical protein
MREFAAIYDRHTYDGDKRAFAAALGYAARRDLLGEKVSNAIEGSFDAA